MRAAEANTNDLLGDTADLFVQQRHEVRHARRLTGRPRASTVVGIAARADTAAVREPPVT
jgi:hypothetical protein